MELTKKQVRQDLAFVWDWLAKNDWIDQHEVELRLSERGASFFSAKEGMIRVSMQDVENECSMGHSKWKHIHILLHEVGHYIHHEACNFRDWVWLTGRRETGLELLLALSDKLTEKETHKLYLQLPVEAEAEVAREELAKLLVAEGIIDEN